MKKFFLGMIVTILLEAMVFMVYTCRVQVKTTYTYNPDAIVALFGNEATYTTK